MSSPASEQYLKTIAKHAETKPNFHIIQTGNTSLLRTFFDSPLHFSPDCSYEIALTSLETYYSFPNIDAKNNIVKISLDKEATWKTIKIPTGCYGLKAIDAEFQRQIIVNGGKKDDAKFEANRNTFQCILTIKDNIAVNFETENSLRSVLGFKAKKYRKGRYESEKIVNIMRVNSIMVHCDIIGSSYLNGIQQPIIYSFFPDVNPGNKIISSPQTLIYLPVTLSIISQMTSWLTDQDEELLDLRGEELTLKFHIKAC